MASSIPKRDASTTWAACDKCNGKHAPGSRCPPPAVWLGRGTPASTDDRVWLKRRMPDGAWPPNPDLPRDDSFSWLARTNCGHQGGTRLWAFYTEEALDSFALAWRDNSCMLNRCPAWRMNHG